MRLIDAKVLERQVKATFKDSNPVLMGQMLRWIRRQTTVDAVLVIRCKDCKHYDNSEGIQWCKINSKFYPGGVDWHCFPEDGFCSYGERKGNETDQRI